MEIIQKRRLRKISFRFEEDRICIEDSDFGKKVEIAVFYENLDRIATTIHYMPVGFLVSSIVATVLALSTALSYFLKVGVAVWSSWIVWIIIAVILWFFTAFKTKDMIIYSNRDNSRIAVLNNAKNKQSAMTIKKMLEENRVGRMKYLYAYRHQNESLESYEDRLRQLVDEMVISNEDYNVLLSNSK